MHLFYLLLLYTACMQQDCSEHYCFCTRRVTALQTAMQLRLFSACVLTPELMQSQAGLKVLLLPRSSLALLCLITVQNRAVRCRCFVELLCLLTLHVEAVADLQ